MLRNHQHFSFCEKAQKHKNNTHPKEIHTPPVIPSQSIATPISGVTIPPPAMAVMTKPEIWLALSGLVRNDKEYIMENTEEAKKPIDGRGIQHPLNVGEAQNWVVDKGRVGWIVPNNYIVIEVKESNDLLESINYINL